jgi:hypothetical protein
MANYFETLNTLDVSKHIEKKGGFSYLSWPYAVAELRKRHPYATWEVVRFNGLPYLSTDAGCFVEVAVTVENVKLSQIHPVLDVRNQPIKSPTAFQINTSLQRALVKAIALHGLGLYIYAGEDLPEETAAPRGSAKEATQDAFKALSANRQKVIADTSIQVIDALKENRDEDAYGICESVTDADEKVALWGFFDSKQRSRLKAQKNAEMVGA